MCPQIRSGSQAMYLKQAKQVCFAVLQMRFVKPICSVDIILESRVPLSCP